MSRLLLLVLLVCPAGLRAELISLEIHKTEPFADGKSFGDVGPYEKLTGVARFAVDPMHVRNRVIVDVELAPRNQAGKVEFAADVFILAPKDRRKGNGAILYDVNNRGNRLALGMFNSGDPGNGFLCRRGYTVVWSGWDGELLTGGGRLLLKAPIAVEGDKPIRGVVRYEMMADAKAESQPLSRRENHGSYPPTAEGEKNGVLTWRLTANGERTVVPRSEWELLRLGVPGSEQGVRGTLPHHRIKLAGGFKVGVLYELICEAEGPIVQGLGFAGVRDLVGFLKYDHSKTNPLLDGEKSSITRAHAFGVSQSGRFLRHFLYQGFNADEKERKVFDGVMPHVAGGGLGFFNHRFAQPTRHNGQHEEHLYPGDMFPFTYGTSTDPFSKRQDGILSKLSPKIMPKVMHTQSAAEYWHRSGSLVHTDPLREKDAVIPENVRIYAFGGTQHGPASDPPGRGVAQNLLNPGDYKPHLRALLDALDAWVKDGKEPPASVYPRLDNGTLVDWTRKGTGFPELPGVRFPEVIQQPHYLDYGPDFRTRGILSVHPPRIVDNYRVGVPKNDADGNDLGCLLPPEVGVPLATYTGWNLRRQDVGAENMLASLMGSYLPFAKTEKERKESGDPRRAVQERYASFADYERRFKDNCERLIKRGTLLPEDAARLAAALSRHKKLFE